MIRRLVLGDGALGRTVTDRTTDQPGELYVVTGDSGWVTTLREKKIAAIEGDPADPTHYPSAVDVVVVAADDSMQTERIAAVAREEFPEATIIAAVGLDASTPTRDRLAALADELVDPREEITDRVLDATASGHGGRMGRLLSAIRSLSKPLAVVAHDNPDPDAIASAVGLVAIAESVGVPADAYYFGEISHQENRALVNLLDLSLYPADPDSFEPSNYGTVALVDHSQPGVNDSLLPETPVGIVVDHHPPRMPIDETNRYVDIRPDVGSTSTIITEYFRRLGLVPEQALSTALLYGIQTDTKRFTREVSEADFEAAAVLSATANEDDLDRIESPSVTASVVETLATAIQRRDVRDSSLATCVGQISDRDALAQAADDLLNMEGVTTVLVYGYTDDMIYVSGRTRGASIDLGEILREALDRIGSAGGHANMAGAQLPLGIISEVDEDESLIDVVHELVAGRFFAALDVASEPAAYMINPPLGGREE
ncbi:DHH family phosphoesterase [Halohasta litorea]|uniref:Bifunctional oligoribonuclease/PAP phosphatase NrnA n=1 Tax=Halohasta litorea TaxID=869891 RepID=A0ABD6D8W8_9EURY|nr:bifunctional oligoribonuclease/PAP phosphatase NrnA [Halohasta litorea]